MAKRGTNERILWICRWLWDKNLSATVLDEVDGADISHDFGARTDIDVKLYFQL